MNDGQIEPTTEKRSAEITRELLRGPSGIDGFAARLAMRQYSRRGALAFLGKVGLVTVVAASGLNVTAQPAAALGCDECWGPCNACSSTCCCPCGRSCSCTCTGGCYACTPTYIQAHMLWILGYIPNCTCPAC